MLERTDLTDPVRAPFGKPTTRLTTPNIFDLVVVEEVPISPETYRALPKKSPHQDYANNGLVLVWEGPVKAANNQIVARRVYASESEAPENWYNYAIKYSADAVGAPIYVRSYIVLREEYQETTRGSALGALMLLRMTNRGSGYTSAPTVALTGGGGSGATAKAIMVDDKVIGLQILTEGTGYTSNPTVGFSGGGGSGAAATAIIQPVGAVLIKEETAKLDSEDPQLASLFIRVHRIYETLPGPWVPFTRYDDNLGPIQGRRRSVLATAGQKASLSATLKRTYEGRDGSSIVSLEIEEGWTTGEGTEPNPAFPIRIRDTYTDERGAVDGISQIVNIAPDEETQEATLSRNSGVVTRVQFEEFDEFHLKRVEEHWVEVIVNDKRVTSEYGGGVLDVTERTDEPGAQTPDTGFLVVDSRLKTKSPHEQTKITEKLSPDSAIPVLELVEGGAGFSTPPAVSFSGGTAVTPAVANAVLGFGLASITVNNGGSGYTTPPAVGFMNGGGGGAFAVAVLGFGLGSVIVSEGGGGYTSAPTVAVTGDGSGATGTAILGFAVASIAITAPGTGPWTSVPTVAFSGDGSGATANVIMGHPILAIAVSAAGSGYTSPPTVSVTGGGGTGGAGTAVLQFTVASATITAQGSGYTTPPIVAFSGGGGAGAAGVAVLGFGLSSIDIVDNGTSYSSAPTVGIVGDGTGAAGTAVIGKIVASVAVSAAGSGYTSFPTGFGVTGGGGTGANINIRMGLLTVASIVAAGTGYAVNDILDIVGGTSTVVGQLRVTSVGGSGEITGASIETAGVYSTISPGTRGVTGGGGTGATFTLTYKLVQINLTSAGTGYTSTPTITIVGGGGSGAAGTATLAATGTVKSITLTAPGSGYTTPPTINLTGGGGSGADAVAVLLSTGTVVGVTITTPGAGYTSAPTIAFTGDGTGAAATAVLSSTGSVKSVTLTPGAGYTSAPTIGFTGGAGTGAAATATIDEAVLQPSRIDVIDAGSGYTSPPTLSFVGGGGTGLAATATLATAGKVVRVNVTAPGTDYTYANIGFSGGGGSGAIAAGVIELTGRVIRVDVHTPGSFKTVPTVIFDGGGGSGAIATAVLSATGSVIELVLTTPGLYTIAPTVVFTGAHTVAASAIYHIGSLLWPANRGFTTDPTEGIVVNHIKKVVPEGTPHPGRGNFVDMLTHDRWKSIQIVSAVDLDTLPLPETYWTTHAFHLYPTLLAVEGVWSDVGSKLASAQANSAHVIVSSGASGGIIVRRTAGYHGYAKAYVTRIWFFGPPPESAVPLPLKIIGSSGSVVITSKRSETRYTNQDDGGSVIGDEDSVSVHALDVSDHLVGAFQILNATHQSRARNANAMSGGGNSASLIAYGQVSTMTVSIPSSNPPSLVTGQMILVEAIPQKWRFGVWVLELIYVRVP